MSPDDKQKIGRDMERVSKKWTKVGGIYKKSDGMGRVWVEC